jgi:hypothetical protein
MTKETTINDGPNITGKLTGTMMFLDPADGKYKPYPGKQPVAWRLKDDEASEYYKKPVYRYYDRNDFKPNSDPTTVIIGLEPLYL